MQQKQAGLGRNRDPHLVRHFQPGAAFETLLRQENLDVTEQLFPIVRQEMCEKWQASRNDFAPGLRDGLGAAAAAAGVP